MTAGRIDIAALHAALDAARVARGLTWRQTARAVGVSPSTLCRIGQGHRPDVDGFAALVQWLGVPAEAFMPAANPNGQAPELEVKLAIALATQPDLQDADREFLREVLAASIKRIKQENE